MRYLSTFSGIGGFEVACQELKGECVGFSEINKYAKQIYLSHFPHHHDYGDITKIIEKELPDFDLLVGGFPCQTFSIAGKRAGFDDTRGTMFFELCRIAKEKRPRFLLFENVKGLLNHAGGQTYRTIVTVLDELGYDVQWQVCNSRHFGVPQHRERIIIVGHTRTEPRPQVFPIGETDENGLENRENQKGIHEVASTLTARMYANWGGNFAVMDASYTNREPRLYADVSPTIRSASGGHHTPMVVNYKFPNSKTRRGRVKMGYVGALETSIHQGIVMDDFSVRRFTPLECERLQGFPDNWTEGVSDTQRYNCLGNAVTVNVIRAIVSKLPFNS